MVNVVLVRTVYSRNIGSVSRVMGNMGAHRLILINSQCDIDLDARQGAAGAQTHLLERTTYTNWTDFYKHEPDGVKIAFSARDKKEIDTLAYAERLQQIHADEHTQKMPLYLIFGPEDQGLDNEDFKFVNYICKIPIFGSFKSLNLSHAVLLALFIEKSRNSENDESAALGAETNPKNPLTDNSETQKNDEAASFLFPEETIHNWLDALGFQIGERRRDMYTTLKRIILSRVPSSKELRALEAVIQQTIRKLKD